MTWGREDVFVPTTMAVADGASDIGFPPIVIGGPPGCSVCPPITTEDAGPTTTGSPPIVPTVCDGEPGLATMGREDVWPSTTIAVAAGATDIELPPRVTAGPPGVNVCEPTTTTEEGPTTTGFVPIVPTVCNVCC